MKKNVITNRIIWLLASLPFFLANCSDKDDIITYNPVDGYGVCIELANSGPGTAVVNFIPEKNVVKTEYALGRESDREGFISGSIAGIQSVVGNEPFNVEFEGLSPESLYTVFAKSFDNQGNRSVSSLQFNTAKTNFQVTGEYVSDVSAAFRITCDATYERFVYAFGRETDREAFKNGTLNGITSLKETKVYIAHNFNLEPEKDYVFFCIGYDRFGNPTPLFEKKFATTPSEGYPDVDFNADIDIFQGIYTFTPNEHCGRIVVTAFPEGYGYMTSLFHQHTWFGDLFSVLEDWANSYMGFSATGETLQMALQTYEATLNMKIHVYAVIYDNDLKPYCAKYFGCKTPSYDPSLGKATVAVELAGMDEYSANLKFTLGENTMGVMFDFFTTEAFDELMNNGDPYAFHNFFFNNYYMYSWIYARDGYDVDGVWEWTYWDWFEEGQEYYLVAAPMNYNGPGIGWGDLYYRKITVNLSQNGNAPAPAFRKTLSKDRKEKFKLYKL